MRAKRLLACATSALAGITFTTTPLLAAPAEPLTATPIQHLVVIFQENISFDHYFGTYPVALNPAGETKFKAAAKTPDVNGLTFGLLTDNPNFTNPENDEGSSEAANPFRLDPSQAATSDQDHDYTPEQMAFDGGLMDLFPLSVGTAGGPPDTSQLLESSAITMGYYDGNTVTAYWNYAQNFAMSDNSYGSTDGPSTVGALNLISGQTNGATGDIDPEGALIPDGSGGLTDISDADPVGDSCSTTSGERFSMTGPNIGVLLNKAGITWGWFEGGFDLGLTNANGTTSCKRSTLSTITNTTKADYIPHHEPFQYYTATQNLTHARPTSTAMIGYTDAANHQYDIEDFKAAVTAGNFPAVSFLKAPGYQDGHAGYSDPLDEQTFVANVINFIEKSKDWNSTAVIIAYDDSDGWYDHQMPPIINQSATSADALTSPGHCGSGAGALPGVVSATAHAEGRCGYGPRLPLLVISPYAKANFVDHTLTDQSSIIHFIEDNWLGGERLGQGSFDAEAGLITGMFDFTQTPTRTVYIEPSTGVVTTNPPTPVF